MSCGDDFIRLLSEGPVVFDGAMGTMLFEHGVYINRCFDEMNLVDPDVVREIHSKYLQSGADVIETNTFGANRFKLGNHGLADRMVEINRVGAQLALEAVSQCHGLVAGAMGPLGIRIEPWGPTSLEEAREAFREQAHVLVGEGVHIMVLETFGDLREMGEAIAGVREAMQAHGRTLPIVAQMTVGEDGNSLFGTEPEVWATRLDGWGVDVIGVNCSVGPKVILDVLERIREVTNKPLSAQPTAGRPTQVEDRLIYLSSPDYMAGYARRYIQVGARVVGGCCGTTPEHIRVVARSVRQTKGEERAAKISVVRDEGEAVDTVPAPERSAFARRVSAGEFVATCELLPPRGWDLTKTLERVRAVQAAGFHAVNIPDGPRASAKMGPFAMAVAIERELGLETVMHYVCRDRNILGMQSDLLGAYAMGLRNLLLITGDPPIMGDYPDATAVFDIDSIGLTNMVRRLNSGLDLGGRSIGKPTGFFIGVGLNPTAINPEREMKRLYWKVDAGAEFAITQPVFDGDQLERCLDSFQGHSISSIPVLAGIWPLQSLRNAEFLKNEVPGTSVPEGILKRMAEAGDPESERSVGLEIAIELLERVRSRVQGVQIAAPLNRHEAAVSVLRAAIGDADGL